MDRAIQFRFYRITSNRADIDVSAVLEDIYGRDIADRAVDFDDYAVRLEDLYKQGRVLEGEFVRVQKSNLPPRAPRRGRRRALGLDPDEGLGHTGAFIFDPALSVILLQRNRNGIGQGLLTHYLNSFLPQRRALNIEPVLTNEAWQKLNRSTVRSIQVRVAEPDQLEAVDNQQQTLIDALTHMKAVAGGEHVTLSVGMGRHKVPIHKRDMIRIFRWLAAQRSDHPSAVTQIQAGIQDPDSNEHYVLDLLKAHMGDKETVNIPDNVDQSFAVRIDIARRIFRASRVQLRQQFAEN